MSISLHCGWPKTGTTSLQAALANHRGELAEAGIVYPDELQRGGGKWSVYAGGSHNLFPRLLQSIGEGDHTDGGARRFLRQYEGRDVLISSEGITLWMLQSPQRLKTFVSFLGELRKLTDVKCIWTLRRFDELIHAIVVNAALTGAASPDEPLSRSRGAKLLAGMQAIEGAIAPNAATYVKYDAKGLHTGSLLAALGLPEQLADAIDRETARSRLHVTPTQKQVVAAVFWEEISVRLGLQSDRSRLVHAIKRGELRFEDDRPCVLLDPDSRRDIHREMLKAARACDFPPYERFFGDEDTDAFPPPVSIGLSMLTDADLEQLATLFRS